ncbi:MAG: hypothetical protein PVF70_12335 [Anaerolineales bacterium]|jgi:hypothetical protein
MNPGLTLPATHWEAVRQLISRLPPNEVVWALTGSAGLRLQGIDLSVADLDVQTDKSGAKKIVRAFADCVQDRLRYRRSPGVRSYFARLEIAGVQVEVMGELRKRLPDGSWEPPVDVEPIRRWAEVDGLRIPVIDPEYEARAYEIMGRTEKAQQIRRALDGMKRAANG